MPNWTRPSAALIAPTEMMTSTTVTARRPGSSRYEIGTMEKSNNCLQSMKLTRGSTENSAATRVANAYAASGQNVRGTSIVSCSRMTSVSQSTPVTVSSVSETKIEKGSAAAKASRE